MRFSSFFIVSSALVLGVAGFNNTLYDNVVVYWGQNSHGAFYPNDTANYQQPISFYCKDDAINVIPIAFLNKFNSTGGLPEINLSNICNPGQNGTFPGTALANCQNMSADIQACQAKGKLVTLSLGGDKESVSFTSDAQAETFADTVWDLFLGGFSDTRPFGDAVLDGIDLDIESGATTGYAAFVNRIRYQAKCAGEKYHITASPQCMYPDISLGGVLNMTWFDAVHVQFYNNPCGLQNYSSLLTWNFGIWDHWARHISPNKHVKVYLGAPAEAGSANAGYVSIAALKSIAVEMRNSYPSFGGVMLWDASQAHANGRYDLAIKKTLKAAGGVGFTYPACSAPGHVPGQVYTVGEEVSHRGYMWGAKCTTNTVPSHNSTGDWSEVNVCTWGGF